MLNPGGGLLGLLISASHYIPKPIKLFIQILLSKKKGGLI
jgi:hypothetical protein